MKLLSFLCLVFYFPLAIAQDSTSTRSYTVGLQIGEGLRLDNKLIKFKEVVSDSRCPTGVTCVWAGSATILLQVFEDGKLIEEKVVTIPAMEEAKAFISTGEKLLRVAALNPYPDVDIPPKDEDYCLDLLISETSG